MKSFQTHVYTKSKRRGYLIISVFFGFISLLFNGLILPILDSPWSYIYISVGLICSIIILWMVIHENSIFLNGIEITGEIEFHDEYLKIENELFYYNKCSNIIFHYTGYPKSKENIHVYNFGNFVEMDYMGIMHKYFFCINSEAEKENLVCVFKKLYENKIEFKESTFFGKSYLLKTNLNYSEIQEFKSKNHLK